MILETERYILKVPQLSEVKAVFEASRTVGFNDGMYWEPTETAEELEGYLRETIREFNEAIAYTFSIYTRADNIFVGRISVLPEEGGVFEIGFFTLPDFQNRGVQTESVKAVTEFAFTELAASMVYAGYADFNKASKKVLEKSGFEYEGHVACEKFGTKAIMTMRR